jgi:hypothetical protein
MGMIDWGDWPMDWTRRGEHQHEPAREEDDEPSVPKEEPPEARERHDRGRPEPPPSYVEFPWFGRHQGSEF